MTNSSSNHSILFSDFFFKSCAPFYDFSIICHSNHHSITSWHQFDLKKFMNNHRHIGILYTDLQEVLRSSEQDRGHGKRGCTERDSFELRLMYQSVMHHVFLILLNRRSSDGDFSGGDPLLGYYFSSIEWLGEIPMPRFVLK